MGKFYSKLQGEPEGKQELQELQARCRKAS